MQHVTVNVSILLIMNIVKYKLVQVTDTAKYISAKRLTNTTTS